MPCADCDARYCYLRWNVTDFDPSNLVPGTGLSPDKMLMGRIFSYHDTHLHRIGPNYQQLPVNAPRSPVQSYNKDGPMTHRHAGSQPVYAPNSYGGPQADPDRAADVGWQVEASEIGRYAYDKHARTTTSPSHPRCTAM